MLNKKIAFIGPGVMAEAMIAGLLRKKLAKLKISLHLVRGRNVVQI